MTTDFTGSDAFPALINGPEPGSGVTAASVNDPMVQLANRSIWLKNRTVGRASLLERVADSSSFGDSGPTTLQDMKAVTAWTDIAGVEITTTEDVAEGDIVLARCCVHVRSKRADAGFLGLRLVATYDISGTPATANATTRRWVGDSAAHDLVYIPVDLFTAFTIAADADSTLRLALQGKVTAAGNAGDDLYVANPWTIEAQILRPVTL